MKIGLAQCVNKGMQRDYSMDKASQEFAYENRNIRITTTGNESFLSVTNERSTENINLIFQDCLEFVDGFTILGSATIGDYIIIFGTSNHTDESVEGSDYIYRIRNIDPTNHNAIIEELYHGNLDFRIANPIECITSYEADEVQKVYWVDGENQPRVINVCKVYDEKASFDFNPNIPDGVKVNIEKEYNGSGNFVSGVIQYFITFYNKYGSETSVAYESPLFYISPKNRGGEVNEKHTCSFKISIEVEDNTFEYARVYSMIRTSLNSAPQAYIVKDVQLDRESKTVQVVDNNILNTPISASDILFLGGNTIIAKTIEQKDNTLFLGDITEKTTDITSSIKKIEDKGTLQFGSKFISYEESKNPYYPYNPNLDISSRDIKTFKYLEWYKIGIQFQLSTGEWSSVVELGDIQNTIKPNTQTLNTPYSDTEEFDDGIWLPALSFTPSEALLNALSDREDIKNWRLVMAEHSPETRTIKAQGLVIPTIFNLEERANNTCFSSPLWTLNSALYAEHLGNVDVGYGGNFNGGSGQTSVEMYPLYHLPASAYWEVDNVFYKLNSAIVETDSSKITGPKYLVSIQPYIKVDRDYSAGIDLIDCYAKIGVKEGESIAYHTLTLYLSSRPYGQRRRTLRKLSEAVSSTLWSTFSKNEIVKDIVNIKDTDLVFWPGEIPSGDDLRNNYGIYADNDTTVYLPTYVRDVVYSRNLSLLRNHGKQYFVDANICNFISPDIQNVNSGLKFRIIGFTDIVNSISDYIINVDNDVVGNKVYKEPIYNLNTFKMPIFSKGEYFTGIKSLPLWPYNNRLYYIHYWSNGGYIVNNENVQFKLKSKKFANMWVCGDNTYASSIEYGNISDLQLVNNESVMLGTKIYKADYQNVLVPGLNKRFFVGGDKLDGYPSEQPVNESTPLDVLAEVIADSVGNGEPTKFIDDVPSIGSINIQHKTSEHIVFQLPNTKHGLFGILPNYQSTKEGNGLIYSDSIYPLGQSTIDIFITTDDSNACILEENFENSTFDVILTPDSFKLEVPDTTNAVNIDNNSFVENSVVIYHEPYKAGEPYTVGDWIIQPTLENLYNKIKLRPTEYNGKVILVSFKDREEYLVITLTSDFYVSEEPDYTPIHSKASVKLVSWSNPILYYYENSSFILDNIGVRDAEYYKTFNFYKSSIAISPYTDDTSYADNNSKIFLGEFYTDYDKDTFFGGDSKNCIFIPISQTYSKDSRIGWGLEGDTYYQRYDNVRIYEAGSEDVNQNIDAVSFMLETYKNLDGDYRKQRGRLNTTTLTVENTNDVRNEVYSQVNDYRPSYVIEEKDEDSNHPSLYVWSLSKQTLAYIDTWTSINLLSSLKLDGDKGALTKIKRWNNHLLAFQEKGLAIINFNQQTTISTSEGVPIEIANSGKVTGHYYVSSTQGCKNKWSITDSPYGLYFIDSYNKSINLFNSEGIKSLSTINLFQDWIVENEKGIVWDPTNNGGFKSFYDPIHKETYFVNDATALCYNELLGQFTSFYDYANLNSMLLLGGHIYGFKDGKVHIMFEGDTYCNLFDNQVDFSMTYKINKDPFLDKTWTNIEYKADIFESGDINNDSKLISRDTFDNLTVWNEYQNGVTNLKDTRYPNARCKFRIWRADIPRDEVFKRDRIRNPWIMLKLEKTSNTNKRMEFHDLVVKYLQ